MVTFAKAAGQLVPRHARHARHAEIYERQVKTSRLKQRQRLISIRGALHLVTGFPQLRLQHHADDGLVFGNQDSGAFRRLAGP